MTNHTAHGNPTIRHLATLYDEAKARIGRSLSIYDEVSDMIDALEEGATPGKAYDSLCQRLRAIR